jgi:hypothetical protein
VCLMILLCWGATRACKRQPISGASRPARIAPTPAALAGCASCLLQGAGRGLGVNGNRGRHGQRRGEASGFWCSGGGGAPKGVRVGGGGCSGVGLLLTGDVHLQHPHLLQPPSTLSQAPPAGLCAWEGVQKDNEVCDRVFLSYTGLVCAPGASFVLCHRHARQPISCAEVGALHPGEMHSPQQHCPAVFFGVHHPEARQGRPVAAEGRVGTTTGFGLGPGTHVCAPLSGVAGGVCVCASSSVCHGC